MIYNNYHYLELCVIIHAWLLLVEVLFKGVHLECEKNPYSYNSFYRLFVSKIFQKQPRVDDDAQLQVMIIIIDHFNLHTLEMFLYTKIIPVHIFLQLLVTDSYTCITLRHKVCQ
jgi:hypothetical protein